MAKRVPFAAEKAKHTAANLGFWATFWLTAHKLGLGKLIGTIGLGKIITPDVLTASRTLRTNTAFPREGHA